VEREVRTVDLGRRPVESRSIELGDERASADHFGERVQAPRAAKEQGEHVKRSFQLDSRAFAREPYCRAAPSIHAPLCSSRRSTGFVKGIIGTWQHLRVACRAICSYTRVYEPTLCYQSATNTSAQPAPTAAQYSRAVSSGDELNTAAAQSTLYRTLRTASSSPAAPRLLTSSSLPQSKRPRVTSSVPRPLL